MTVDKNILYLNYLCEKYNIPGAQLSTHIRGSGDKHVFFGYKNLASSEKVSISTKFRIASLTKILTTIIILDMVCKNLISLDSTLGEILNLNNITFCCDKKVFDITISELLHNISGINDIEYGDPSIDFTTYNNHRIINNNNNNNSKILYFYLRGLKLNEKSFIYSTFSYWILSVVVEIAYSISYGDYIKANFNNLKSIELSSNEGLNNESLFYNFDDKEEKFVLIDNNIQNRIGMGGLVSSTQDYLEIIKMIVLFNSNEVYKLFNELLSVDNKFFGGIYKRLINGQNSYSAIGGLEGCFGFIGVNKNKDIQVAFFNSRPNNWKEFSEELHDSFFNKMKD
jgi:hypothetical protein